jgi:peptidoglycan/LPS O-acetylase OafA/YrhL
MTVVAKRDVEDQPRLAFVDALRGVAILGVLLYHSYFTWPGLTPADVKIPLIRSFVIGNVGVQLFFIVSGFVIFMSLEKSRDAGDFLWKRWLRLFPAMLIASMVIFVSAPLFPERLAGVPETRNLLAGLTFVQPEVWTWFAGGDWHALEMPFWTLFVEVKFYILVSLLHFSVGPKTAIRLIFAASVLANTALLLAGFGEDVISAGLTKLVINSGFQHFAWFAAGAVYWRAFRSHSAADLHTGLAMAVAAAVMQFWQQPDKMLPGVFVAVAFAYIISNKSAQDFISNRFFLFLGFISYPLYLMHENMTFSLVVKLRRNVPDLPAFATPALALGFVIALVWIIARYAEPAVRNHLRRLRDWLGGQRWRPVIAQ